MEGGKRSEARTVGDLPVLVKFTVSDSTVAADGGTEDPSRLERRLPPSIDPLSVESEPAGCRMQMAAGRPAPWTRQGTRDVRDRTEEDEGGFCFLPLLRGVTSPLY